MGLTLKSENQIQGSMFAKFLAETGITDINAGSVIRTLIEAAAQEDFQQYVQMLAIIRNYNLDSTTGTDLDNRAFEYGVTRNPAKKATGVITIYRDSTFVKVSTSLYSGLPAPVAGATKLRVNDASNTLFGTSGTLIVGRGTVNEEQVTYTVAPVNFTNYYEFTVSPFSNNHGVGETVILKQGLDITIPAGTLVTVPAVGTSPDINFALNQDTTLLAGEDKIQNVAVTATVAGSSGNIPINAITGTSAFQTPPFAGARASNDSKFTTGADQEIDDDLRNRLKNQIQSLSKGTKTALLNAITGLVDPQTAKRVVSANLILPVTTSDTLKLYIDDGTGFEPSFLSQGFESLLDSATGGETRLQLQATPLVKAQLETNLAQPYNMSSGPLTLSYTVGLVSETITFNPGDFTFPQSVSAGEIVTLINKRATLIEARTSQSGNNIVIASIQDLNETIQITGGTANAILNFPTDSRSTLYLYIDDVLKSKDGSTASLDSGNMETFNFSGIGAAPWPLNIIVDGKSANPQTVNLVASDFASPGAGTAAEVARAINARLSGAVAISVSGKVRIISNTLLSSASGIQVTGGSANSVLNFSTTAVFGTNSDYMLNPQTGIVQLTTPLNPNQAVTAGSKYTRAKLRTVSPEFYNITAGQTLVVSVDGGANQTVTFATSGTYSASAVAALINSQLFGATAIVRTVGGLNYLEMNTNTYTMGAGSLQVLNTSTATVLNFPYNTVVNNQRPNRAFQVSANAGPYNFTIGQNLVIILDNNPAAETFTVIFNYNGSVNAAGATTTQFTNSAFNTPFPTTNSLNGFYAVFTSGQNFTSGTVASVTNTAGNTWRYNFSALPANMASFVVGDHFTASNMLNTVNNGTFLITAVNSTGNGWVEVTNISGAQETGSTGTGTLGARRQISAYNGTTGAITVGTALPFAPANGDAFAILPSTLANVVLFLNNTTVTTLPTKAFIEAVSAGTKLQISSQLNGSDGYVVITGGSANALLGFSTTIIRGLQGYNYYTGLLQLVHRTVYGFDQDLVTFPGVGAAGVTIVTKAPTVQQTSFSVSLTLAQGVTLSSVSNDVKSTISGYVNSLGVGQPIILTEIIKRIKNLDNIVDVKINTPAANIATASNQVSRTRDSLITVS